MYTYKTDYRYVTAATVRLLCVDNTCIYIYEYMFIIVFKHVERQHSKCHVSFQFLRKVSNYPSWAARELLVERRGEEKRGTPKKHVDKLQFQRSFKKEVKDQQKHQYMVINYGNSFP